MLKRVNEETLRQLRHNQDEGNQAGSSGGRQISEVMAYRAVTDMPSIRDLAIQVCPSLKHTGRFDRVGVVHALIRANHAASQPVHHCTLQLVHASLQSGAGVCKIYLYTPTGRGNIDICKYLRNSCIAGTMWGSLPAF